MRDKLDVFLSHNSRDKPIVEEIAARLRNRGFTVLLDRNELRPDTLWYQGLEKGAHASWTVAVFVGEDGLDAWPEPEIRALITRSRQEEIPVLLVLLPGCLEFPQLALFQEAFPWVDLRKGLHEEGLARLAWRITNAKREAEGLAKRSAIAKFQRRAITVLVYLFILLDLLRGCAHLSSSKPEPSGSSHTLTPPPPTTHAPPPVPPP